MPGAWTGIPRPVPIDMIGTGPLSPVYKLSHQTDGASLAGFPRRC